jgi:hypothetical protein
VSTQLMAKFSKISLNNEEHRLHIIKTALSLTQPSISFNHYAHFEGQIKWFWRLTKIVINEWAF